VCVGQLVRTHTNTENDDGRWGSRPQLPSALFPDMQDLFNIVGFHLLSDLVKVAKCFLFQRQGVLVPQI
jgi:hypothetical protein